MERVTSDGGRSGRVRRVAGGTVRVAGVVAFAATPWLSGGFATPIAFLIAAVLFSHLGRAHAAMLWISAAVYTALAITEFAQADAGAGTPGEIVFLTCMLIAMVGGGVHALVFVIVAAVNGYRPKRPTGLLIVSVFLALLIVAVGAILVEHALFQRHHRDAVATVVSVEVEIHCSESSCTDHYRPTVRFVIVRLPTERPQTIEAATADTQSSKIKNGDVVTVHYDPDDPTDVRLSTGWDESDWFVVGTGVFLVVLTVIAYARDRYRGKSTGQHAATPRREQTDGEDDGGA